MPDLVQNALQSGGQMHAHHLLVGRQLDEADRGCLGHALEVGESGQRVTWTNESTGLRYEMVPGADRKLNGAACREFSLLATSGAERSSRQAIGCQSQPGVWEIVE